MKKKLALPLLLSLLLLLSSCGVRPGAEKDNGSAAGGGEALVGQKVSTVFFDFTLTEAEACADYEGYTAAADCKLIVADLAIHNTVAYTLPMGQYDFMLTWGEGDDAFAYPLAQYSDKQFADEYELSLNKFVSGALVFQVPADQTEFTLDFEEYHEDGTVGELHVVRFSVE